MVLYCKYFESIGKLYLGYAPTGFIAGSEKLGIL